MAKESKKALVPKLRFPEFRTRSGWECTQLGDASTQVTERVGERKLTPVSISAGVGFVPQAEKFGRDISGNQYSLYTLVRDGDFVYNKGNSLKFPQGCVYQLRGWGEVAAPSVFISFRLKQGYVAEYFQYCFEKNIHGVQLKKHITSGARSNGLLNVSKDQFYGIDIPAPLQDEQQKIADCLSSLDELIAAQGRKVEALKTYKRGLMQQLFPREGETLPRLRFPEFRDAPEWKYVPLGELLTGKPEYGVNAPAVPYSRDLPTYLRITDIDDDGRFISTGKVSVNIEATDENYLSNGDIVLARTGASVGKSYRYREEDGRLVFAGFLIRIKPNEKKSVPTFVSSFLTTQQYWAWVHVTSARSGQPGINGTEYAMLPIPIPPQGESGHALSEQQRIADCLISLDARIVANTAKLTALRLHKQGLMQQLFPSPEEA